jgi:hypothetical protein
MDLQDFQTDFDAAKADEYQPKNSCEWNSQNKQCQCSSQLPSDNPAIYQECIGDNRLGQEAICG